MRKAPSVASIRAGFTYANVVSSLSLFLVLGGVSYAAATLPTNSVSSKQIASKAVGNTELRNNAVTSAKVKAGSLRASDFAP